MAETFDTTIKDKPTITKDPNAVLDYVLDLTDWLALNGDALQSVSVVVTEGLTVVQAQIVGTTIVVWLSGGNVGKKATATIHFTTNSTPQRQDDRTLYFKIKNR